MRKKGKRANEANTSSFECTPKSWERLTRNYKYLRKIAFISSGSGLWWFEWELPPTRSLVFEPLIPSWWWSLGRLRTHGLKVCSFSICFPCLCSCLKISALGFLDLPTCLQARHLLLCSPHPPKWTLIPLGCWARINVPSVSCFWPWCFITETEK